MQCIFYWGYNMNLSHETIIYVILIDIILSLRHELITECYTNWYFIEFIT